MGNEKSTPSNIKFIEIMKVTDDWIQKLAIHLPRNAYICIFEQSFSEKNVDVLQTFSKNLMLYRHPCILKYITSWRTNKSLNVATEYAKPLTEVIEDLMPMQLCVGLYSIVKAINFLQEMALSSHNNLSKEAIYVTCEGDWKLAGLESMTSKKNRSSDSNKESTDFVDELGFATLALDILNTANINHNEIPALTEFKEFCSSHISANNTNPHFFQQLLLHPFFNHQFINIYNFLTELPAKNETEKSKFFKSLLDELKLFPEELVARQFSNLLLSRLVLLNISAQDFFLPKMFTPKQEHNQSLFSKSVLQKYISPRLVHLFSLRDSQIRLIILQYFSSLCTIFNKNELETKILPELLVGIKDTNELLVAATLRALADLVPILGAAVVVGKGRAKLFADGRPTMNKEKPNENFSESKIHANSDTAVINGFVLAERPSPDGGEDVTPISNTSEEAESEKNEKSDNEINENHSLNDISVMQSQCNVVPETEKLMTSASQKIARKLTYRSVHTDNEDLSSLDIKCSRYKCDSQYDDIELMFKTMEPVISKTEIIKVSCKTDNNNSKFNAVDVGFENLDGWDDETTTWIDPEEIDQ